MSAWSNCTAKKGISDPFGMCANCITLVTTTPTTVETTLKILTSTPASVVCSGAGTIVPPLYKWMVGSEQGRKSSVFLNPSIHHSQPLCNKFGENKILLKLRRWFE
uniref:Ig-like domain-containing protein n=1 Tax=Strongyloides papillosus TaxID=174720 RepID=A0A0N5CIV9_STREA